MVRKIVLSFIAAMGIFALASAQQRQVSGTVTGHDGSPIAGATVLLDGTSIGTTTGADGSFAISVPADGTLAISFIGYQAVKVPVAGKTRIDVTLHEDTTDIDDVIVFFRDGKYIVTPVADKKFVGKNILYVNVFKKNDKRTIYNVTYRDGKEGTTYIKRFAVTSVVRDREYDVTQGTPDSRITYFSANPNGEAEIIKVTLKPTPRVRRIIFEQDFSEVGIKGRQARGIILTRLPVHKIALKQRGGSTLGGRKVWFDRDILRLNYDGRGEYLGEFQSEDTILVVLNNGDFYTSNFDLSNHYEDNVSIVEKFDSNKVWTAALYDADQQNYPYLKRFCFEGSNRKQNYLGENKNNRLILLTDEYYPRLEVIFGGHDSFRDPLEIEAEEFIAVKGFKAKGKRITTYTVETINELEPTRFPEPEQQTQEEPEGTNLLKNGDFSNGEEGWSGEVSSPAEGKWDFTKNNATVTITNAGTAAWNVNLKQNNVTLKKGAVYEVKATLTSDVDRTAEFACMDSSNTNWYVQDANLITLKANEPTKVTFKVGVGDGKTDNGAYIGFNLGKISEDTPDASVITIDDVSMIKISGEDSGDTEEPEEPEEPSVSGNNILRDSEFENGNWQGDWGLYSTDEKEVNIANGSAVADLKSVGTDPWSAQLKQENIAFEAGAKYILKMTVNAEVSRIINVQFNTSTDGYIAGTDIELAEGDNVIKQEITVEADKETVEDGVFKINLGKINDQDTPAGKLVFHNVTLVKVNNEEN